MLALAFDPQKWTTHPNMRISDKEHRFLRDFITVFFFSEFVIHVLLLNVYFHVTRLLVHSVLLFLVENITVISKHQIRAIILFKNSTILHMHLVFWILHADILLKIVLSCKIKLLSVVAVGNGLYLGIYTVNFNTCSCIKLHQSSLHQFINVKNVPFWKVYVETPDPVLNSHP